jgi:hypothetical protein
MANKSWTERLLNFFQALLNDDEDALKVEVAGNSEENPIYVQNVEVDGGSP